MKNIEAQASVGLLLAFGAGAASAQLSPIFKIGGATLLVSQFGRQINSVLNRVTGENKVDDPNTVTKVVSVLSAGSRGAIGIVQVSGPRE